MGHWRRMLSLWEDGSNAISDIQLSSLIATRDDWPPHLALMMAFLNMYGHVQNDLNALTGKRLDFYYEDVLKIQRRSALADTVHPIFTLAKKAAPVLLKAGSQLKAGTTAEGLPLMYSLDHDHVVSEAKVALLSSTRADRNISGKRMVFKADDARQITTQTGSWLPFGIQQIDVQTSGSARRPGTTSRPAITGFNILSRDVITASRRSRSSSMVNRQAWPSFM